MSDDVIAPETVTERVAVVVVELMNGEEMTTREVAELAGLSRWAAWVMMSKMSRVIPIYFDKPFWKLLREVEKPATKRR